jgi:hypothetical protein
MKKWLCTDKNEVQTKYKSLYKLFSLSLLTMTIAVIAIGSRGDVQPFVALCCSLQRVSALSAIRRSPSEADSLLGLLTFFTSCRLFCWYNSWRLPLKALYAMLKLRK